METEDTKPENEKLPKTFSDVLHHVNWALSVSIGKWKGRRRAIRWHLRKACNAILAIRPPENAADFAALFAEHTHDYEQPDGVGTTKKPNMAKEKIQIDATCITSPHFIIPEIVFNRMDARIRGQDKTIQNLVIGMGEKNRVLDAAEREMAALRHELKATKDANTVANEELVNWQKTAELLDAKATDLQAIRAKFNECYGGGKLDDFANRKGEQNDEFTAFVHGLFHPKK